MVARRARPCCTPSRAASRRAPPRQAAPRPEETVEVLPVVHPAACRERTAPRGPGTAARARLAAPRAARPAARTSPAAAAPTTTTRSAGTCEPVDRVARGRLRDREHEVGRAHELEPGPVAAAQTRDRRGSARRRSRGSGRRASPPGACPVTPPRAGHSRLIGTSSSNGEQTWSRPGMHRRRRGRCATSATAGDERLDRARAARDRD